VVDPNERSHSVARPVPPVLSAMLRASDGILELLPIATFICDAEGTILQYNRHAVAVWGVEPQRFAINGFGWPAVALKPLLPGLEHAYPSAKKAHNPSTEGRRGS
jgi:PAS domain-containing protein